MLHTILNTGIALGTVAVSLLFWDLGWRTSAAADPLHGHRLRGGRRAGDPARARRARAGLGVGATQRGSAAAALRHLGATRLSTAARHWRGVVDRADAARARRPPSHSAPWPAAVGLFALFQWLPRYAAPGCLGIVRPTLLLVPLLWIPVGVTFWRRRRDDRIAHTLAYYALGAALAHTFMLYSDEATSKFAMTRAFRRVRERPVPAAQPHADGHRRHRAPHARRA